MCLLRRYRHTFGDRAHRGTRSGKLGSRIESLSRLSPLQSEEGEAAAGRVSEERPGTQFEDSGNGQSAVAGCGRGECDTMGALAWAQVLRSANRDSLGRSDQIQPSAPGTAEEARLRCHVCGQVSDREWLEDTNIADQVHGTRQLSAHPADRRWFAARLPDAPQVCLWISDRRPGFGRGDGGQEPRLLCGKGRSASERLVQHPNHHRSCSGYLAPELQGLAARRRLRLFPASKALRKGEREQGRRLASSDIPPRPQGRGLSRNVKMTNIPKRVLRRRLSDYQTFPNADEYNLA